MSDHFTMTISQSTLNRGKYQIHQQSDNKPEELLVEMNFRYLRMLDEEFLDGVVKDVAKELARRIFEINVCGSEDAEPDWKARKVTDQIIRSLGMTPRDEKEG